MNSLANNKDSSPNKESVKSPDLKLVYSSKTKQAIKAMSCHKCQLRDWSFEGV